MPTPTTYQYTISTLPAGKVDLNRLTIDIQSSSIVTALDSLSTTGDVISVVFKDALSTADKTTLDNDATPPTAGSVLGDHTGEPLDDYQTVSLTHKLTSDGRIRVASEKSDAESLDVYSHNFADKTTWYPNAVRVVEEVATNVDGENWSLENDYVIDVYHGKITTEDRIVDSGGNSYRVVVLVDDVAVTEVDPHTEVGDYTVDYEGGNLIFDPPLAGTETVKVTYHYATDSKVILAPDAGKKLIIEVAEVQFTDDIILTDTVVFETFGYVDVFAPHLVNNPIPSGTKIPIKTFKYKTMKDFQNAAFKSYPTVPAIGGIHWRGLSQPVCVFDWDYQRGLTLLHSAGMEVHVYLEHDAIFGGSWATATFYCGIDDES